MNIILVRHGLPEAASNSKMNATGFAKWVRAYNHSNIHLNSQPPEKLTKVLDASYVFSSNLNRAVHSATICTGRKPDRVLSEFRELDIPRFKLPLSMSINSWLFVSRVAWFMGLSGKSESMSMGKTRVAIAADRLVEQSCLNQDIAVFGHGLFNRYLAKELERRGWIIKSSNRGYWGEIELVNSTAS